MPFTQNFKSPLKILIVHNYYQIPGGEDIVVENEKKMLENHGHEVILYSRHNLEIKNFNLWKKLCLPFTAIYSFKTYREVKQIIAQNNINIVHVHNTLSLISPSVYYAALSCKRPVVQTVHNFRLLCPGGTFYRVANNKGIICEKCVDQGLKCALKHKCYRGSRIQTLIIVLMLLIHRAMGVYHKLYYICLTEFNKDKLLRGNTESIEIVKKDNIFIKPNMIVSQDFASYDTNRKNQFVFVGRLERIKGIQLLLKAWKQVNNGNLVICGIGPDELWCKQYIIEEKLTNIKMLGYCPNNKVRKIIANSKALIFPTQVYENFPMALAEALSVKTPVICGDIGNAGLLIKEGINGLKFQYNSADDLTRAINKIQDQDITFDFGTELIDCYEEHNYKLLLNIYHSLMGLL